MWGLSDQRTVSPSGSEFPRTYGHSDCDVHQDHLSGPSEWSASVDRRQDGVYRARAQNPRGTSDRRQDFSMLRRNEKAKADGQRWATLLEHASLSIRGARTEGYNQPWLRNRLYVGGKGREWQLLRQHVSRAEPSIKPVPGCAQPPR